MDSFVLCIYKILSLKYEDSEVLKKNRKSENREIFYAISIAEKVVDGKVKWTRET